MDIKEITIEEKYQLALQMLVDITNNIVDDAEVDGTTTLSTFDDHITTILQSETKIVEYFDFENHETLQ